MKRNSSFAKILLAAILFQTHIAVAQTFTQQTSNEMTSDASMQPLVCQKVPAPNWNSDSGGQRPMVDDPACVAENNNRANARANVAVIKNDAARITTGDGTQTLAPKAPLYTCGSITNVHSTEFQTCQNNYNAQNAQYQKDLQVYNITGSAHGDLQNAAELKAIEDQKNKTATATLAEIKDKNDQGKKSYDKTSAITKALGIAALMKGTACASSCPYGCCPAAPGYFALAAAMFLLSSKAKKQAGEHAASAQNACESLNQLSSQASSCAPPPSVNGSGTGSTTISYDPVTGKCLPEGSEECKQLPGVTASAPNVKDALKTSGFASGKNMDDQYKLLSDGSVQMKNGKVFKDGDFKDANALMAAGLSASAAKGVMDSLAQASGGLAGLSSDAKSGKKDGTGISGALGGADGATSVVDVNRGQNSDKKYGDDLGADKKNGKKFDEDRKPSSEGLAKEFNGELIGVAGDDIFLMMNRRYKLKSEQDSFIAQDLK
ncbi:hypothetical protein CIK05_15210 [Bdellovibrio sp. qaytius]|nr:hypothetical protein CIK05_15210 [Bdellovibrio sp. qaytius]